MTNKNDNLAILPDDLEGAIKQVRKRAAEVRARMTATNEKIARYQKQIEKKEDLLMRQKIIHFSDELILKELGKRMEAYKILAEVDLFK